MRGEEKVMRFLIPLLLLITSPAFAQVYRVRIVSQDCRTGNSCQIVTSYGSAVCVGRFNANRDILLTCRHVVQGQPSKIEVDNSGQWVPASVLGVSQKADLALIGVKTTLKAFQVASSPVRISDPVSLSGYPHGGAYRSRGGNVIESSFQCGFVTSGAAIIGESGGAVTTRDGRLVGVIFATYPRYRPTQTLCEGVAEIRDLFASVGWPIPQTDGFAERPESEPDIPWLDPMPTEPPCDDSEIIRRLDEISKRITQIERTPGPKGERGLQGETGPAGKDGKSIDASAVQAMVNAEVSNQIAGWDVPADPRVDDLLRRMQTLESEAVRKSDTIEFQITDPSGNTASKDYPITGPVKIKIRERQVRE